MRRSKRTISIAYEGIVTPIIRGAALFASTNIDILWKTHHGFTETGINSEDAYFVTGAVEKTVRISRMPRNFRIAIRSKTSQERTSRHVTYFEKATIDTA